MTQHDPATLRILDANLNRAREGLRVMEEYARFVLEDQGMAGACKTLRHELIAAIPPHVRDRLVPARDTHGDVGTVLTNQAEEHRTDARHVATASAKRLAEALRVIEEYSKTIDAGWSASVKQLRYRGYELERLSTPSASARARMAAARLYVLITESACRGDWFGVAERAIRGGADAIQLREKELCDRELLDRARRLAELCRKSGTIFIVNDRPDIAALCHADGVHLGQDDLTVSDARRLLPPGAIVGVSTHDERQLVEAAEQAPDYIAVGPMFASTTKPQDIVPGPALLAHASTLTSTRLVAIGGITAQNVHSVLEAGSCTICVCSAVVAAADVEEATGALRRIIDRHAAGNRDCTARCGPAKDATSHG